MLWGVIKKVWTFLVEIIGREISNRIIFKCSFSLKVVGTFYLGDLYTIVPRIHFATAQVAGARLSFKKQVCNLFHENA